MRLALEVLVAVGVAAVLGWRMWRVVRSAPPGKSAEPILWEALSWLLLVPAFAAADFGVRLLTDSFRVTGVVVHRFPFLWWILGAGFVALLASAGREWRGYLIWLLGAWGIMATAWGAAATGYTASTGSITLSDCLVAVALVAALDLAAVAWQARASLLWMALGALGVNAFVFDYHAGLGV